MYRQPDVRGSRLVLIRFSACGSALIHKAPCRRTNSRQAFFPASTPPGCLFRKTPSETLPPTWRSPRLLASTLGFERSLTNAPSAVDALHIADFDDPNIDKDAAVAGLLEDDSPYPEVRSAVANTDDTEIPCSTFRAWVLGLAWAIIIPVSCSLYLFFSTDTYPF